MAQPLVLLGLGGSAASSEFTLTQIASACPVVLADTAAPAWARPYLARHLCVDPADGTAVAAVVSAFASAHQLRGVLTYTREHLVTAARIAEELELPAASAQSLALCTDRAAARAALAQHAVPLPVWAEAQSADAAAAHADAIGYPVFIRARFGNSASGLVGHRSELNSIWNRVIRHAGPQPPGRAATALVEEHLDGPQVAAETVVLGSGDVQIVAITRTSLGPPPAVQAVRHCVHAHDNLLHNRMLRQTVARAVDALDVTPGVLHVEMALTSRGPRITDVVPHLADDLIPLLVKRATGINLPQVAADLALGRQPNLGPTRQRAAAVHFTYPAASGWLRQVSTTRCASHPLLDRAGVTKETGRHVESAEQATVEDRLAHWVVLGSAAGDCHALLGELTQGLEADIVPAPSLTPPRRRPLRPDLPDVLDGVVPTTGPPP